MASLIGSFFCRQVTEIEKKLKWFGVALGFIHVITAYFWWGELRNEASGGVCWSFFTSCESYQNFLNDFVYLLYPFYLSLGFFVVLFFFIHRFKWGYFLLLFTSFFQAAVQISDYRFMGNYHYMHHVISFIFLFLPEKTSMIQLCLVLFYFFSGLLRFDLEWLSGAALLRPVEWIPRWVMDWLLLFVIYLEVLLSWLLLARQWLLKYSILFCFFVFHAFSYFVVGYFFPLLMLALLSVFIIDRSAFKWPVSLWSWGFVFMLSAANLYPHIFEPQAALHGRGRLLALNMLDAKTDCRNIFYIRFKNKTMEYIRDPLVRSVRVRCDYTMVFDKAKKLCKEFQEQAGFIDIDMSHQVRKSTEESFSHNVQFQDICRRPLRLSGWGDLYQ